MRKCPQLRGGGPRRRREEPAPVCSSGWGWAGRDATWRAPSLFVKVADFLYTQGRQEIDSPGHDGNDSETEEEWANTVDGLAVMAFVVNSAHLGRDQGDVSVETVLADNQFASWLLFNLFLPGMAIDLLWLPARWWVLDASTWNALMRALHGSGD